MKKFSKQLDEYKLSISSLDSIYEQSFSYWLHNYIDSKDVFEISRLMPGKLYSFEYNIELGKKKFINKRPISLFIAASDDRRKFSGIDIILIPPEFRSAFFERIQSVYTSVFDHNYKMQLARDTAIQDPIKINYEILSHIMRGIPFKNAYRTWDIEKIRDIKEISYDDWTKITYLHTRAIEGISIEEIYNKNSKI